MSAPVGVPAPPGLPTCATTATLPNSANTVNSVTHGLTRLTGCTVAAMGKLDPDDPRAPYQQVADDLRAAIESGQLAPGAQLPALPTLTAEYGVSTGTARSALNVLRDAGLIVTRQGQGSFVRTRPAADLEPSAFDELKQALDGLAQRVEAIERKLAD